MVGGTAVFILGQKLSEGDENIGKWSEYWPLKFSKPPTTQHLQIDNVVHKSWQNYLDTQSHEK